MCGELGCVGCDWVRIGTDDVSVQVSCVAVGAAV